MVPPSWSLNAKGADSAFLSAGTRSKSRFGTTNAGDDYAGLSWDVEARAARACAGPTGSGVIVLARAGGAADSEDRGPHQGLEKKGGMQ
jgi:hypothetical protein